ncbi:MAG TPA: DUF4381 domain-containing protein [Gammaproteobacteria bacterium]|nr:DUF4381 domain-containing protein [Gammaproteobacteria bacterium]
MNPLASPGQASGPAINPAELPLKDIHLPEAVSWWPPAPGWWLLLAAIILLGLALVLLRRWYKSRQLQRDIHAELARIKQTYKSTGNRLKLAQDLSILLRRAAISWYPQGDENGKDIAGLTGEDWLAFLDRTASQGERKFQSDTGRVLLSAPYLPADSKDKGIAGFDADALIALSESWLLAPHKRGGRRS